jgi:hypothetical protein
MGSSFPLFFFLTLKMLLQRARTEPRTAAMIFEDILRDKAEFNDCSEGLYLAINARRQWLQIYRSGIQRKAFFINNYHFRYRLLTEECMCRWRLAVRCTAKTNRSKLP